MDWVRYSNPTLRNGAPVGTDVLVWKDGWLSAMYTICIDPHGLEDPALRTFWYPIARMTKSAADDYAIGAKLVREGDGLYRYADVALGRVRFRLTEGGRTQAIAIENQPIPRPPTKIVKTRKKKLPMRAAPYERITHHWESRFCRWEPGRELISWDEADALGLEY